MVTYHRGDTYRVPDQTDYVYTAWCDANATTTTSATWTEWTCTNTTTTTPITDTTTTWYYWTSAGADAVPEYQQAESRVHRQGDFKPIVMHHVANHRPTEEQREQRSRQQAENERRYAAERAEQQAAKLRADELLHMNLTDVQRSDLARDGFFFVDSLKGNKYRIRRGRVANVDAMRECGEKVLHKLCAHPQLYVPDGDTMLAQKLMLEHNEDEFLRLANRS